MEQIEEYRNQIEYYKKEVDRLKNGDSIESKIKLDEIERHLEQERQKSDDYSVQVIIQRLSGKNFEIPILYVI